MTDYRKLITEDKSRRIIAAMAQGTGKPAVVLDRILAAEGNVLLLGTDPEKLEKIAGLLRGSGAVTRISTLYRQEYTVGDRKVTLMTWAGFEEEAVKKQWRQFRGLRFAEIIGMEAWQATETQLRLADLAANLLEASHLVLIGTPCPMGKGATAAYHSGTFSTHKVRYNDSPNYNAQAAGRMIAEIGAERALYELCAEVPSI